LLQVVVGVVVQRVILTALVVEVPEVIEPAQHNQLFLDRLIPLLLVPGVLVAQLLVI
jgi:hypothetical protein